MPTISAVVVFGLVFIAISLANILTYRRLWRPATSPYDAIVYARGVKQFGLSTWLAMTFLLPLYQWHEYRTLAGLAERIAIGGMVGFSLGLWGGYAWGTVMAAAWGIRKPRDPAV